jgi:hypothetical protein
MIVAIERNLFNYILKYNCVTISNAQLFDVDIEALNLSNPTSFIINEFDRILPVFEQDQEILILEVDKCKLNINNVITLSFGSIISIFPLTIKAKNILSGKLNQNLELKVPIFEKIIEEVKSRRAINYRELAFSNLANIYHFTESLEDNFTNAVQKIIIELLNGLHSTDSYLFNLLHYNYTPNEISSGNIEYLEKIGIIAFAFKAKTSEGYTNSPFYLACEKYKKEINKNSYSEGYRMYHELIMKEENDSQWKQSDGKIKAIVSEDFENLDLFKISYFYLAIKTKLNKNDGNLIEIDDQLIRDLYFDQKTMIHVLYLICFTFSFEQLYESIHLLTGARLFEKRFLKRDIQSIQIELQEEQRKIEVENIQLSDEEKTYNSSKLKEVEISDTVQINTQDEPSVSSVTEADEAYTNEILNDIIEPIEVSPKEAIEIKEIKTDEINSNVGELVSLNESLKNSIDSRIEVMSENKIQDDSLTVRNFETFILENVGKEKLRKNWIKFLKGYFPDKDALLSIENLDYELSHVKEPEETLFNIVRGNTRFDRSTILEKFFKKK